MSVNGEAFLIKRGETVEVPEKVANVLYLSELQKISAEKYIRELSKGSDIV